MRRRTLLAIPIGIILGCALGFSVRNMGYTAYFPVLLGGVINPLIVYGIAARGAIWVSVVPNVTTVLMIEFLEKYTPPDRIWHLLTVLWASIIMSIIALVAIAPSYWVRNRAVKTLKAAKAEEEVKAVKVVKALKGESGKRQQSGNPFL